MTDAWAAEGTATDENAAQLFAELVVVWTDLRVRLLELWKQRTGEAA